MNVMKRIEEEMERFPEGSKNHNFFKQLCKKLKPDILREPVKKELNESRTNLSGSIQKYFQQHIIYSSVLKAVDGNRLEQNEADDDNVELFYLNILKKYVNPVKSSEKLELFEESRTLVANMLENKQKSKSAKLFSKLVEDNINEFCMQFSECALQKKVNTRNWEKEFDSAVKKWSHRAAILDSTHVKFNATAPELQTMLSSFYKELTEGIEILSKLLELFHQKMECQSKLANLAVERSLFLKLKIELLELELLVSTYSESAVKALQIIKVELDKKIDASKKEINKLNNDLKELEILGPEYEQLVEKYGLLLERVEKQKWAIEFLKADIALKQKED